MPKALILYQSQQLSMAQIQQLDALLLELYNTHVSPQKLLTIWNQVPLGQAFTNYQDSKSSLVTIECANGFPQHKRVGMLQALDTGWRAITAQQPQELMLALVEKDMFATLYHSNRKRLSRGGQFRFAWHILRAAVQAKRAGTPLLINPNL